MSELQRITAALQRPYRRMFRIPGMRFLINDLWMRHYRTHRCAVLVLGGEYTSYMPEAEMDRTLAEGALLLQDDAWMESYVAEFHAYLANILRDGAIVAIAPERGSLAAFFDALVHGFALYEKTEFFYTDQVFLQSGESRNLTRIGALKNKAREAMNSVYFGDGYLPRVIATLATQFDIPIPALLQYGSAELLALFNGARVDAATIARRDTAFIFLAEDGAVLQADGAEAATAIRAFEAREAQEEGIRGVVANPGYVRATVKRIVSGYDNYARLAEEMAQMTKGQVLVAETTSPELMAACEKAGAIVTDQGGLLSHAAIVSREFGIPCIVGTRVATKRLKDGDTVEVDAIAGEVRLIT